MSGIHRLPESNEPARTGPAVRPEVPEAQARLWRAVAELPRPECLVMRAHLRDELTWAEVAYELGVCVKTVKLHAMRGVALLRLVLPDHGVW